MCDIYCKYLGHMYLDQTNYRLNWSQATLNFDPTDPKVTGPLQKPVTRRWCEVSPRMWPLVRGTICLSILGARDIGTVKASKCQMVRRLDSQKSGWPEFQMAKIQFLYRWIFRVEPLFYPHFWHSCTKFCGRLSPLSPPSQKWCPWPLVMHRI